MTNVKIQACAPTDIALTWTDPSNVNATMVTRYRRQKILALVRNLRNNKYYIIHTWIKYFARIGYYQKYFVRSLKQWWWRKRRYFWNWNNCVTICLNFLSSDINECIENPRICLNGHCENTPGSYHCICQSGFTPSRDNTFCVDMDECSTSGMCENGKCVNMKRHLHAHAAAMRNERSALRAPSRAESAAQMLKVMSFV